jgi:hypothetical protein
MKTLSFAMLVFLWIVISSEQGEGTATFGYKAYWLTNKELGEYVDLILLQQSLLEMPRGSATADKPLLNCDGIIVRTYAKDSIWNRDRKPFKPLVGVERVDADSMTMNGREFKYQQAELEDVLRLFENPEGKIPIHRIHGPISGQEEVVKSLLRTIKQQLTEKKKEANQQKGRGDTGRLRVSP